MMNIFYTSIQLTEFLFDNFVNSILKNDIRGEGGGNNVVIEYTSEQQIQIITKHVVIG